ncbi:MAG: hypothetical protein O7F73_21215 [Gammaproteobacteria bacterium]|nr:hypothetical protein [Gammaproteobacteria bacterium]
MSFFRRFKSIWGIAAAVIAMGPLGLLAPGLQPPWPAGSVTIAVIISVAMLILAGSRDQGHRRYEPVTTLVLGVIFLLAYFLFFSLFVVEQAQLVDGQQNIIRFVVGYERLPGVGPDIPDITALQDHGFQPSLVWTPVSLLVARLTLLGTFYLGFGLIAYGSSLMSGKSSTDGKSDG